MAGIVEPDEAPARLRGPVRQRLRLGPGHVGGEAAQPQHPGTSAGLLTEGDAATIGAVQEFSRGGHARSGVIETRYRHARSAYP